MAWIALGLQLVATVGAGWVIVRHEKGRDLVASPRLLIYVGLGLPVGAAVGYVVVDSNLSQTDMISPALVVVILGLAFAMTCGTTLHLALTRPRRINPQPATADPDRTRVATPGDNTAPIV
jgi:hypothetical protein